MIWLVTLFLTAITAMAFGLEYLSLVCFVAGLIVGVYQDRRDQQARATRARHDTFMREVRRQR